MKIFVLFSLVLLLARSALAEPVSESTGTSDWLSVTYHNNMLSVDVRNASVETVLTQIAHQTGASIEQHGVLRERVTLEFSDLSLAQGLRRVLRHRSFTLQFDPPGPQNSNSAAANLNHQAIKLWILDSGWSDSETPRLYQSERLTEQLSEKMIDITGLRDALQMGSKEEQEEAIAHLGDTGLAEATEALSLVLMDTDENLRMESIESLADIGSEESIRALQQALWDEHAKVRESAVDALGEIGSDSAIHLLKQALTDEAPFVREAAQDWLEELEDG